MDTESTNGHGGERNGAGRKRRDSKDVAKWLRARGIEPATAAELLARVCDERRVWQRLLTSPDDRVVLETMKFLTVMRDGKPAQRIHVTSTNLSVTIDEIAAARRIVAEIVGATPIQPTPQPSLLIGTGELLESKQEVPPSEPAVSSETKPI